MISHRTPLPLRNSLRALLLAAILIPSLALAGPRSPSGKNFTGENPLGVSRAEFAMTQEGMELIYQRRYSEALEVFEECGIDFPDSPVGPVGRSLVWQAMMFENYDFSRERPYLTEYAEAKERLKRARRGRTSKSWLDFLEAVHLGLDAMYDIRKGRHIVAFDKAWDALELIKKVERRAPEFHDVHLALGMYNYWRTALTEQVDVLPSFGDHRAEGLAQMKLAKDKGLLARAPASLVLTYSYLEKRDYDAAIAEGLWARERYPNNLLNELTLARVYRRARRYDDALAALGSVQRINPENHRVWFHIGEVHYKSRRDLDKAREAYTRYLGTKPLPMYEAYTFYRLGMLERRQRHYDASIAWLEKAVATWPRFKTAEERLQQVREEKERRGKPGSPAPKKDAKPRAPKASSPS